MLTLSLVQAAPTREQRTMSTTGTRQKKPAEKHKMLERLEGRNLTQQEINLSLDQARAFGEL